MVRHRKVKVVNQANARKVAPAKAVKVGKGVKVFVPRHTRWSPHSTPMVMG